MTRDRPFKWFKTSPEIIRLAVMRYIRFPLSLPSIEDRFDEPGVEAGHDTVRYFWYRFTHVVLRRLVRFWAVIRTVQEDGPVRTSARATLHGGGPSWLFG